MKTLIVTPKGMNKLREEVESLRGQMANLQGQTAEIMEVGGNQWHDNASFDQQGVDLRRLNAKLKETQETISRATIASPPDAPIFKVEIGTCVRFYRGEEQEPHELVIVGYGESDPDNGLYAYDTPFASQFIGKRPADEFLDDTRHTKEIIYILSVQFAPEVFTT
ncbi:MAG: GreA/GreB family elongation factor [Patescibacteria group bacterium]